MKKYLYVRDKLIPRIEETVLKEVENQEPYVFRGKLLCIYQRSIVMNAVIPHCIVKLFRTDDGEFLLYSHFYTEDGQATWPRTILRSSSPHKIFTRIKYQLESTYNSSEDHLKSIIRFLQDLSRALKI